MPARAITVFEVITAVAFHLFAQTPADLCVLEVGLGGRGDATNVIDEPAACAITSISLDHRELLGDTLALIAAEKAGIMKPGVPVAIGAQPAEVIDVLLAAAARVGAPVLLRGRDWRIERAVRYSDAHGALDLPPPSLPGAFQLDNAGIAIAALRASGWPIAMPPASPRAEWPARLQRLHGTARGAAAGGLGALAGRRPQSRRRHRAGRASAALGGSAGASGRRHEADEGRQPSSCVRWFRLQPLCGPWRSRGSTTRVRSRRSSRRRAASRGRVRTWPTRCAPAARPGGARADLRQPLSGGRSAEAGRMILA